MKIVPTSKPGVGFVVKENKQGGEKEIDEGRKSGLEVELGFG